MKKLILLIVLCTCGLLCETASAQISFKINIGSQPLWGPVGYNHVEYYYLPEVEAYYYVPTRMYFYMQGGRWISRASLPLRYRNFNMYSARKIVINEPRPYLRHNNYKVRYARSNGRANVQAIRDSRDSRYFEIKDHPEHSKWKDNNKDNKKVNNKDNKSNNGRNQVQDNRRDRN